VTTPSGPGLRAALLRPAARELWTYLAAGFTTMLATVFALRLWAADLRVPFNYVGDAVAVGAHVQTVLETGWYERQPLLGWPAGQAYHDFPTADNLNFAIIRVLGLVSHNWPTVINLYYIIGFPLAALTGVWFLRRVGVSRVMTVTLATLFAIAPYHFLRAESHLWLASYFTLPLALVIVLDIVRGESLWPARTALRSWRGWWPGVRTVACLGLLATASTYYAVFVLVLLATAGLAAWLRTRDTRRFVGAVVAGVVVIVTVWLNMLPDILYVHQHGASAAGFLRSRADVEIYALKLSQLLLPVPGHRIPVLAELRAKYDAGYPLPSEQPALGFVAGAGFVFAMVVIAWGLAVRGAHRRSVELSADQEARTTTIAHLSLLTFVAFLSSTVGGLATFISFFTASLRGWNRMSIVIAALCLGIVGLVLDAWVARARRRWHGWRIVALAPGIAALVLVVGTLDQVTPGAAPNYPVLRAAFDADATWVGQIEAALPADAAVFELPYQGFPETPPLNGVYDSDQLKGFLHSTTLRWSGGAIKGRPTTDWPEDAATLPAGQMADELAISGFAGIQIDRMAYGPDATALEQALTARLGPPAAQSADGRYVLYSLVATARELTAANDASVLAAWRRATLEPVRAYPGPGAKEATDGIGVVAVDPGGSLTLENPQKSSVRVRLTATVTGTGSHPVTVTAFGVRADVDLVDGTGTLTMELDVPPGRSLAAVDTGGEIVRFDQLEARELTLPALSR
jgi:phosphoglycerol transferase